MNPFTHFVQRRDRETAYLESKGWLLVERRPGWFFVDDLWAHPMLEDPTLTCDRATALRKQREFET